MRHGMEARILTCIDCGEEFVFTGKAQEYFAERGINRAPRRCKQCHLNFRRTSVPSTRKNRTAFRA